MIKMIGKLLFCGILLALNGLLDGNSEYSSMFDKMTKICVTLWNGIYDQ